MKREIFYRRRPFVIRARNGYSEQASSKNSDTFISFSFDSFLCLGSGEAVGEPAEMKQLYISTFPASLLGAHKPALEPT